MTVYYLTNHHLARDAAWELLADPSQDTLKAIVAAGFTAKLVDVVQGSRAPYFWEFQPMGMYFRGTKEEAIKACKEYYDEPNHREQKVVEVRLWTPYTFTDEVKKPVAAPSAPIDLTMAEPAVPLPVKSAVGSFEWLQSLQRQEVQTPAPSAKANADLDLRLQMARKHVELLELEKARAMLAST